MQKWLLLLIILFVTNDVVAFDQAVLPQVVHDETQLLTVQDKSDLQKFLTEFHQHTGIIGEVRIILSTFDLSFEAYINELEGATSWQEKSKSLIMIIATNDKRMGLVVSPDLKKILPPQIIQGSLASIQNDLSSGNYFVGIAKLLSILEKKLAVLKQSSEWFAQLSIYWVVLLLGLCLSGVREFFVVFLKSQRFVVYSTLVPLLGIVVTAFLFRQTPGFWWAYAFCFAAGYYFVSLVAKVSHVKTRLGAVFLLGSFYISSFLMFFKESSFVSGPNDVIEFLLGHLIFLAILAVPLFLVRQIFLVILQKRNVI